MHNPPTPTPSVSSAAAICLAVSAVAAFGLVVFICLDLLTPIETPRAVTGLLAAVCSISGFGYISRSAEDRIGLREAASVAAIIARIDKLEKRMDEHAARLTEQGAETAASVFVAGAANGRHLNAVQ